MSNALRTMRRSGMIAYAGPQRVIIPNRDIQFKVPVSLDRSPIRCKCECGRLDVLCVPNSEGQVKWACVKCGRNHGVGFRPEPEREEGGRFDYDGRFQRQPVEWMCQRVGCGKREFLVLPAGTGWMRWDCSCGQRWGVDFRAGVEVVDFYQVQCG